MFRLSAALGLAVLTGCGDQATTVVGVVRYNSTPVEQGSVSFQPVAGGKSFGAMIENGNYDVVDAQPGSYTVSFRAVRKVDFAKSNAELAQMWEQRQSSGGTADDLADPADVMPEDAVGNGQTVEIRPGTNRLDFDLLPPAAK